MCTGRWWARWFCPLFFVALLTLGVAGCCVRPDIPPAKISFDPHASGDNQCAPCGTALPKPLRVLVEGPQKPGLLGGKGSRPVVAGANVSFEIADPSTGASLSGEGVETNITKLDIKTDAAGSASARVRLGQRVGDVLIRASIETGDGTKSLGFRAVAGVEQIQSALEARTGEEIEEIGLRLTDSSGSPVAGIPVYFHVDNNEDKASVGGRPLVRVATNANGQATTSWKLGGGIRQNFVTAEIEDDRRGTPEDARFLVRGIQFEAMATNKSAMLIELLGGLAVFIFGMKMMSGGLQRMADRKLKSVLQAMTRNRLLATGVGAGLTAMIQSSSATTVMTVGFVNAGLMTLAQAIGVVYGANIGTTVTGQIIAFKLDALAYPAIACGLLLSMLSRRTFYKAFGEAILGFGLLFLGMTTMSGILKPLRHSPEFVALFQLFDCTPGPGGFVKAPEAFMCIVIGTAATLLIQSSSATVGLVLALSGQGLLSFYTAVPLILGDNIGTTITAILASIGANRNAKRAALAHTMFNVFGAAYMYVLLFLPLWHGQPLFLGFVNAITPGDVFAAVPENLVRHVANAHTFFNVFNVALFLPFVPIMARVCQILIPMTDADREQVLMYLEPNLLHSPSLAVQQAVKEVAYMLQRAQKSVHDACEYFWYGDPKAAERVKGREEIIDQLQHEVTAYLVELSRKQLTPEEATLIPALIHAVNDAERVGDHSENILELRRIMREGKLALTEDAERDVRALENLLDQQFEATCQSLTGSDQGSVDAVVDRETEITRHMQVASEAHVHRLDTDQCSVEAGVVFLDLLAHLERIGDHLLNIAERAGKIRQVTSQ